MQFVRPTSVRIALLLASVVTVSVPALADKDAALAAGAASGAGKKLVLDRVVAIVNNAIILSTELDVRMVPVIGEANQISDPTERARRISKLRSQILDEMINEELIVQAAEASKIEVEASEVQAALDEIKQQNNLDDAGLAQALGAQGFTIQGYKSDLRRQLLRLRAVNQLVAPKVTITEEDVKARYDQLQRRSAAVTAVRLSHILIKLPEHPTEQELQEARDRATKAMERIKNGEDFAQVAAQVSDDESTKNTGGELGWFQQGSTGWDFMFSANKGELRGPVSGPQGLHVLLLTDLQKSQLKPYAAMKEELQRELRRREMDKQTQTWLEELRKKAYIDIKLQ
jgi:peptidyl-prolyl cis-trans isomerase SurA